MDPKDLRFTESHEWVAADGTVGISDHAQHEITDVVFVELPKVGRAVKAKESCAVVESVKAAFDIYAPVAGTVTRVNEKLSSKPELVNQSPYVDGWLYEMECSDPREVESLLSEAQYNQSKSHTAH